MKLNLRQLTTKKARQAAALTGVASCAAVFAPAAAAQAAATTGFRPKTQSACSGHLCETVAGPGLYVSAVDAIYHSYPGCHVAELTWSTGSEVTKRCYYAGQVASFPLDRSFPMSAQLTVSFHGVPGQVTTILE
jgi:hypothetical protein